MPGLIDRARHRPTRLAQPCGLRPVACSLLVSAIELSSHRRGPVIDATVEWSSAQRARLKRAATRVWRVTMNRVRMTGAAMAIACLVMAGAAQAQVPGPRGAGDGRGRGQGGRGGA